MTGIYIENNKIVYLSIEKPSTFGVDKKTYADIQELSDIKLRIKNLEDIAFNIFVPVKHDEIATKENRVEEKINTSTNLFKTFELLCKYEDENKSLEEICELLNMKKGEVLLLKNLHKNYQS